MVYEDTSNSAEIFGRYSKTNYFSNFTFNLTITKQKNVLIDSKHSRFDVNLMSILNIIL